MRWPSRCVSLLAGVVLNVGAATTPSEAQTFNLGVGVDNPISTSPKSVAIGEVNGDGRPDLVVANGHPLPHAVPVLLGDGGEEFNVTIDARLSETDVYPDFWIIDGAWERQLIAEDPTALARPYQDASGAIHIPIGFPAPLRINYFVRYVNDLEESRTLFRTK